MVIIFCLHSKRISELKRSLKINSKRIVREFSLMVEVGFKHRFYRKGNSE